MPLGIVVGNDPPLDCLGGCDFGSGDLEIDGVSDPIEFKLHRSDTPSSKFFCECVPRAGPLLVIMFDDLGEFALRA